MPQLLVSVSGLTQVPLQLTCAEEQDVAHTPPEQIWPPGQARPHTAAPIATVPQLLVSVSGFTQVPPQLTCVEEHEVTQVPIWQVWPPGQARAQPPQLLLSVLTLTSQPLATALSQLRNPGVQAATVHAPAAQPAVPLITVQGRLHPPQCATVVLVLVSQPLVALPSQLPSPALHARLQTPPRQLAVPPVLGQRLPQPTAAPGPPMPQLFTSDSVVTSQPLVSTPSQLPRPTEHTTVEMRHMPPPQTAVAPVGGAGQRVPQPPQLVMSPIAVFTSQPLAGLPSQSAKPALQAPRAHRPAAQVAAALAKLQRLPHTPQFIASAEVATSQPLAARLSQLPKPSRQLARVQARAVQPETAPGSMHWLLQALQLLGSLVRSRQVLPQST